MPRNYCSHRPSTYAQNKLPEMRQRWNNAIGVSVRAYAPSIFPGQPPQMGVAFSSNVDGARPWTDIQNAAGFWEIGVYNTPAGALSSPAPNAEGGNDAWVQIATSREFIDIVGRPGTTSSSDWNAESSIPDQVAIGLIDYRDSRANVTTRIPPAIQPQDRGSQWFAMCASMGYTSSTGAVALINRHAAELGRFDEAARFGALLRLAAQDARSGNVSGYGAGQGAQVYPLVRAWERLEAGKLLARETGGRVDWFETGLGETFAAVEHELTKAWLGAPTACQPNAGSDVAIVPGDPNARVGEGGLTGPIAIAVPVAGALVGAGVLGFFVWAGVRYARARRAGSGGAR